MKRIKQSISGTIDYIKWLYDQYSLITALNILDAYESRLFNICVLFILGIFIYSTYLYLPSQLMAIKNAIFWNWKSKSIWRERERKKQLNKELFIIIIIEQIKEKIHIFIQNLSNGSIFNWEGFFVWIEIQVSESKKKIKGQL